MPVSFTTIDRLQSQSDIALQLQQSVRLNEAKVELLPNPIFTHRSKVGSAPAAAPMQPVPVTPTESIHRQSLDDVLEQRESIRFYSDQQVTTDVAARIVRAAQLADQTGWPDECSAGLELDILIAARGLQGAEPAIYRLEGDHFVPLAPLPIEGAEDLVLQVEFATSPLIVIAIAPFADLLARWGDHGERLANTRAAAAIAAALFEANALGVAGSPFAGFLTSGLRRLIEVDGYANAQMFAASFGHPDE